MLKSQFSTLLLSAIVSAIVAFGATFMLMKNNSDGIPTKNVGAASAYVREALLNDPQILEDAITALQQLREQAQSNESEAAIQYAEPALYNDSRDPVLGNKDAKFTIVEFYDYNCGYCKIAAKWTKQKLLEHPDDIRIIFKDFPVLEGRAEGSREASLAAMAAWKQGAQIFHDFHFALMDAKGGFDSERIDEIAAATGVDVTKMRADMTNSAQAFTDHINNTMQLAASLKIDGTPAFIVDKTLISGANTEMLQQLLDAALADT